MKWDNGRTLALNTDADSFRTLTAQELAEEQARKPSLDDRISGAQSQSDRPQAHKSEKEHER